MILERVDTTKEFVRIPFIADITVLVAPTGSGKTTAIVSKIAEVLRSGSADLAVYTVPLKALTSQVKERFEKELNGFKVCRDDGDARLFAPPPDWSKCSVVVATYERTASVLLSRPKVIADRRTVIVVDEFHNIAKRDAISDIVFSSLRLMFEELYSVALVLASATFPNIAEFVLWASRFPASVLVVFGEGEKIRRNIVPVEVRANDFYEVRAMKVRKLVNELIAGERTPVLVYSPSRYLLDDILVKLLHVGDILVHHSKMSREDRRKVEECIEGKVSSVKVSSFRSVCPPKVVVATDTLMQGVNMPFRAGIISALRRAASREPLDTATILQAIGRIGTPGLVEDSEVPVYIIYDRNDRIVVDRLLENRVEVGMPELDAVAAALKLHYLRIGTKTYATYSPLPPLTGMKAEDIKEAIKRAYKDLVRLGVPDSSIGSALVKSYPDGELILYYATSAIEYCKEFDLSSTKEPIKVAKKLALFAGGFASAVADESVRNLVEAYRVSGRSETNEWRSPLDELVGEQPVSSACGHAYLFEKRFSLNGRHGPLNKELKKLSEDIRDLAHSVSLNYMLCTYMPSVAEHYVLSPSAGAKARDVLRAMNRALVPVMLSNLSPSIRYTAKLLSLYFDALTLPLYKYGIKGREMIKWFWDNFEELLKDARTFRTPVSLVKRSLPSLTSEHLTSAHRN